MYWGSIRKEAYATWEAEMQDVTRRLEASSWRGSRER
jgi:hypothetical protein